MRVQTHFFFFYVLFLALQVFVSPPCGRGDAVMAGGGYNFVSPALDWEGVCVRGKCAICLDGLRRCDAASDAGVPQVPLCVCVCVCVCVSDVGKPQLSLCVCVCVCMCVCACV